MLRSFLVIMLRTMSNLQSSYKVRIFHILNLSAIIDMQIKNICAVFIQKILYNPNLRK